MSRNLSILFAVLAITSIASATVGTASPSSAYSIAPVAVATNATDTAFTNLQAACYFTAGFDNTTNYVWCQTQSTTSATVGDEYAAASWPQSGYQATYNSLILTRRTINASSPATKNATLDLKITTSITANDGGVFCSGVGYLGIAYGFGSGAAADSLASDVSLSYIAVNGTAATTVKLTTAGATLRSVAQACLFDNGFFYVMFTQHGNDQTTPTNANNKYMIQAVNVSNGSVLYAAGGVSVLTYTSDVITTLSNFKLVATNWTGYGSTLAILTYTDGSSTVASATTGMSTVATGSTYKAIPITLATGAPGSAVSLGTGGSTTTTVTTTAVTTTISTATSFSTAGVFGSLSTYGVAVHKLVVSTTTTDDGTTIASTATPAYSASMFVNGSSTASTTFNMTLPTGFYLLGLGGYSTADGFGLLSMYAPVATSGTSAAGAASTTAATGATWQWNKDTYFANGTAILSAVSLGTFDNGATSSSHTLATAWIDAAGSPWLGYTIQDTAAEWEGLDLISVSAGQIVLNILSGNVLSTIFATLTFLIAALFAF